MKSSVSVVRRWVALGVLLGAAAALAEGEDAGAALDEAAAHVDVDGDGLPDVLEQQTGTSPLRVDTDRDGVPDGEEDKNQDGVVDPGESDPRRPGLFPGTEPWIPEPMNFDLVRGLGARKGEIEANVLVQVRPRLGRFGETTWAPEIEWAFLDGLAVELELPFTDRTLEAFKLAFQWTAPSPSKAFAHGVQLIGEYLIDDGAAQLTALYLFGGRLGAFSALGMVGGRGVAGAHRDERVLVNPSAYYDLNEAFTLGVETNLAYSFQLGWSGLALAQLHWQIARHVRVQVGAGVEWGLGQVGALVVTRWILE